MVRSFWNRRINDEFAKRTLIWLSGVRRVGKTTLAQSLDDSVYFDCELIRVRRALEEPELFFRKQGAKDILVLDEVHRLPNPSEVLKVATDHFPRTRVVATGSSTLAARNKFRDTLTGRKREVWLLPLIFADLADFKLVDLDRRMLHGGLPEFFLSRKPDDKDYEEWLTSFWTKDVSALFVVEKRAAFTKFMELLLVQSGGLFEASAFAGPCEVSRPTIQHYLSILETTLLVTVIKPYFMSPATEIKRQPKIYGFDTGFVSYLKGWDRLRDEDRGLLLEHLVLGELLARFDVRRIHFWRDKQQHEIDFVVEVGRRRELVAIECKSSAARFEPSPLQVFRRKHPRGRNFVVSLHETDSFSKTHGDVEVTYLPFDRLPALLESW